MGLLSVVLQREHHEIDSGIAAFIEKLDGGCVQPEPLSAALEALRRHIYLEETILFPPIREAGMIMPIFVMMREHGELWRTMGALTDLIVDRADTEQLRPPRARILRRPDLRYITARVHLLTICLVSLIGSQWWAAHCRLEHEGPTLSIPVRFLAGDRVHVIGCAGMVIEDGEVDDIELVVGSRRWIWAKPVWRRACGYRTSTDPAGGCRNCAATAPLRPDAAVSVKGLTGE